MEHVATVMRRVMRVNAKRLRLAPLEPNAFLRWAYYQGPKNRGTSPLTVDDVWFELAQRDPGLTPETVRRDYVRIAARVRRNQRLRREPFEGL